MHNNKKLKHMDSSRTSSLASPILIPHLFTKGKKTWFTPTLSYRSEEVQNNYNFRPFSTGKSYASTAAPLGKKGNKELYTTHISDNPAIGVRPNNNATLSLEKMKCILTYNHQGTSKVPSSSNHPFHYHR